MIHQLVIEPATEGREACMWAVDTEGRLWVRRRSDDCDSGRLPGWTNWQEDDGPPDGTAHPTPCMHQPDAPPPAVQP